MTVHVHDASDRPETPRPSDQRLDDDIRVDNYFAMFDHPETFNVSQQHLDARLHELQRRFHPDTISKERHDTAAVSAPQREQYSAIINQAYQTLSAPDSRAAYLLDRQSQALTLDDSIADLDFLDDAMTMRMELDEAIAANDQRSLQELHPQVHTRLTAQSQRFAQAYDEKDWPKAIDATQKLKFLVKLQADVKSGLDQVASASQLDDDDLYV